MTRNLLTVCGHSSVRAIAENTPEIIERLFFDEERAPLFAAACRFLAQKRKTYRLVKSDGLKKIADTAHHQGAVAVIQTPAAQNLAQLKLTTGTLCLNDVLNPHNIGAILRTAAFFGVDQVILSRQSFAAAMTASAWRVAEGGLTHARLFSYVSASQFFSAAKSAGWITAAALRPEKSSLPALETVLKNAKAPVVVCLGNEEEGLPAAFAAACNQKFTISGSGRVESLNVSVAAALCLEKISRR